MRRILVTGKGGQLGDALAVALPAQGFDAVAVARAHLDLSDQASVARAFAAAAPEAVVNCAAWTAVDNAEDQEPAAFAVNALGPARLAALCAASGIPFVQISTDYVFDGNKGAAYTPADAPSPLSAYGRTKLAGEWAALAGNPHTTVLRTAWVYGATGRNFLLTMRRLGAERDTLRVVADQCGTPTATPDLADAIVGVLARIRETGWRPGYRGVFHATNAGHTTWHGFASAIFEAAPGAGPVVEPIRTADYPTRARRPPDARLDCTSLAETFGVVLPPWEQGLAKVMALLPH